MARDKIPKIAHRIPGRIRIQFPQELSEIERKALISDLKASPDVAHVIVRGTSVIVEHANDEQALTFIGKSLSRVFPNFERWSNEVDVEIAKYASDPWINKTLPLGFLALAIYRGIADGAILAGESAFALAYIGFDIYWKFQQENVIRKIEQGMSKPEKNRVEGQSE